MANKPHAILYSCTEYPIETTYCLWMQSKEKGFKKLPKEIRWEAENDPVLRNNVRDLFHKVIAQDIPISRNIVFNFQLRDIPISLREQMVRHMIGVKVGDNYGVDVIPEQKESAWWSQSMRILDFSDLFSGEMYFTPSRIEGNAEATAIYKHTMLAIQNSYKDLVKLGIPFEDARNVLPLASNMDISWTLTLSALIHILGKRSCWILQYGLWSYLINTMVEQIVDNVDPIFRSLAHPPCFTDGRFNDCTFHEENVRRVDGSDALPVCPLYSKHHMDRIPANRYDEKFPEMMELSRELEPKYAALWGVPLSSIQRKS